MSTFRTPVGPQPSNVYWRRRLVVGLGLLAIIIVILLIVFQPNGATPAGSNTPKPGTSPSSTSTAAATSDEAVACDPAKLTLEPVTDAASYDAGVNPMISFSITSTMTVPCTVNAGSDVQELQITSGSDLIWSSKDCQTDPVAAPVVLQPGVPVAPAAITWDRTRSSADTCDTTREPVTAGGASYHLNVIVGDVKSATSKQFLLN